MSSPSSPSPGEWPADQDPEPRPPGRVTFVGGLPWNQAADATSTPAAGPIVLDQRPVERDDDVDVDPLSWQSLRARFDQFVRRSPPLTASIALHALILFFLAVAYVSRDEPQRPVLELSFASSIVAEEPAVEILPEPEPEPAKEPQPEQALSEKPPVEDPIAAPPTRIEAADEPGAAPGESAAPVIGTLLDGREEGRRKKLVAAYGGSEATEAAVALALEWIVRQQGRDGLWSLQSAHIDPGSQENRLAATAMALLALQGAGNTHKDGRHRAAVSRGVKALVARQFPEGNFDMDPMPQHHTLYSHAQATIALCELYGMTKDEAFEMPARRAVAYAVAAQAADGGWRYEPGREGDMSVTGWFLMALQSAKMAGLEVPEETFTRLVSFLDQVAVEGGARYGYQRSSAQSAAGPVTNALSAEGLLCRQYLGWGRDDPRLVAGVERLLQGKLLDFDHDKDFYAWYYVTQVTHHMGGTAWARWNAAMREELPARQVKKGREAGSWDPGLDRWGSIGGRLYATCFCTYMLEVYYRHLPLYAGPP